MVNVSTTDYLATKSKRMSVTIKEHLVGGGNNVLDTSGDMTTPMRVSNPSINRAALEARRVSTGPMALSMDFFIFLYSDYCVKIITIDIIGLKYLLYFPTIRIIFICNIKSCQMWFT